MTEYSIIPFAHQKAKTWPGGTTTELFIFPATAEYPLRNFRFRISTATVETESSEFTILSGISRQLMVLSGATVLHHEGHPSSYLGRFDAATFEGDWKTSSVGRCTDFNLMTSGNTSGALSALTVQKGQDVTYFFREHHTFVFFYLFSGETSLLINKQTDTLHQGDLLVFQQPVINALTFSSIEDCELVVCEIENASL
ncbi:MAG TPA: HutD family protein [Bacteroidales bacterium]|nr:HutD family protein [Bacteroidales bacterium]